MITLNELAQLSDIDIEKVDRCTLVNVEEIHIDTSMPATQRMLNYLEEVKNPYCFLCGETPVKVCFAPDSADLGKKLKTYFLGLKR